MDSSSLKWRSLFCLRQVNIIFSLLFALLLGLCLTNNSAEAFAVPFRTKDLLPILPKQISWPVMNTVHSAVDLLPSYVGSLIPGNNTIKWQGTCFLKNLARLELTEGDREEGLGGGILRLKV
jgi:hypothetical protein